MNNTNSKFLMNKKKSRKLMENIFNIISGKLKPSILMKSSMIILEQFFHFNTNF